ncbi:hypothetical protein BC936DRAFT_148770 [Jimgerdemannia flammicorona]|uniref:Uncharacterized protein n=2 Tax=Jimgerdemannia flammicorona TaxID=994334 RepID=A0A433QX55_9FUNG|nr:hypothetical protein BC936DRAFT_148770 [Jimgerdemannia flammicorona]RUS34382.1 hypothetical protein BC938DRAFT_480845 [Jimgerdemannia flammicorona]
MILPPSSYPLAGAVYFVAHPQLWCTTLCPFFLTLVTGITSLILFLVFALPAQAHALIGAHCPAWLAWIVAVIFSLLESVIFSLIIFAILLPIFQDALFDATLKARGLHRVFENRKRPNDFILCCRGTSAGLFFVWFLMLAQILALIITAPLHLLPVIGTVISCYIIGWVATWGAMIHYDLEFRSFTVSQSRRYAWEHRSAYMAFGGVALALELIPLAGLIFMWTNVVGAALWVADQIEDEERRRGTSAVLGSPRRGEQRQPLIGAYQYSVGVARQPGPQQQAVLASGKGYGSTEGVAVYV